MINSNTLAGAYKRAKPRYLVLHAVLPFLQIGTSQACFHIEGMDEEQTDRGNSFKSNGANVRRHFLSIEAGIGSGLYENFKAFRVLRTDSTTIKFRKKSSN